MKHILYCADGTWNGPGEAEAADDPADIDGRVNREAALGTVTNVVKLFSNLDGAITAATAGLPNEQEKELPDGAGGRAQVAKYMHGVGDSPDLVIRALGGAFGYGVIARVVRGYTYLSRQYAQGDAIHIVGFSRGAYTARALAGMICAVGLLDTRRYDPSDKFDAYARGYGAWLKACDVVIGGRGRIARCLTGLLHCAERLAARLLFVRDDFVVKVPVRTVAVWDTVGSMGLPLYIQDRRRDAFSFVDARLHDRVAHGFHAMALDERRRDFPVTRWVERTGVEQVWFAGCHSDVGGGYPAAECGLSDLALAWMMEKLTGQGVRFRSPLAYTPDLTHYTQDFHKPWEIPPFNIDPQPRVPLRDDAYSSTLQARWSASTPYRACWPEGFGGCRLV
jgi:uncharacterized protein (DUF2235 family)